MAANQFKAFGIGGGAGSPNTLTPSAYAALTTLLANGFQSGRANSTEANTLFRQLSTAVAALAQFIADNQGSDVNDDGSVSNFKTKLKAALDTLYVQDLTPYARFDNYTGNPEASRTTNGWQKMPGGFLFQWGRAAIPNGSNTGTVSLTFPRAFANGCYGMHAVPDGPAAGGWNPLVMQCKDITASGATIVADTANAGVSIASGRNAIWHAWGYDDTI